MDARIVFILNFLIAVLWAVSLTYSLLKLQKSDANATARAVWAAVIVFAPFLGAIVFLLVTGARKARA